MGPRTARDILKDWVRRGSPTQAAPPEAEITPCRLTAEQRLALYTLLTREPNEPPEPPPLKPEWLPPP